jgi:hypothetical protein
MVGTALAMLRANEGLTLPRRPLQKSKRGDGKGAAEKDRSACSLRHRAALSGVRHVQIASCSTAVT